jgi:hypothetical protein
VLPPVVEEKREPGRGGALTKNENTEVPGSRWCMGWCTGKLGGKKQTFKRDGMVKFLLKYPFI